jgi:hypothetical protein
MKRKFSYNILSFYILGALIFSIGCKRTEIPITPDPPPINPPITVVNDLPQVTASVSGIVLDETNAPISNAVVTSGAATTTTNTNGMFIFQNISLSKENGSVTVVKVGYFKGVRSFKTTEGKNHSVRIQLMQRVSSGTVNAAAGGIITSNGGATIVFPANAFVTSAGAVYTGAVTVYSRWIDPTAANLPFVIPGDLRGVSTNGVENILETYGMVGAELADASGNVLKIATGKTATISFPIPASLSATAPASIVLWHFDDASARWKENGTATKTGNTYTAQVDKFSFWNVDVPISNFINLDYTLINATTNTPLVSTSTRIKRVSNGTYGYGITNNAGFVSGLVPKNEVLVLEVFASNGCNSVLFSQNIGPFAANTSLGNIGVTLTASQYINFIGTLLNCSAAPVTNGYVSLYLSGGGGGYVTTNATGAFSFSTLTCQGNPISYIYQGTDITTLQQSAVLTGNAANGGIINLNNITACTSTFSEDVFVTGFEMNSNGIKLAKIWKNGVSANLVEGTEGNSVFVLGTDQYVAGYGNNLSGISVAKVWKNNIVTNLTNGTTDAVANSVYVSGADVYVAGYEKNAAGIDVAKIWKNGVVTNLSNGVAQGWATSVSVSGTNVYVSGFELNASGISVAKLWTNGVATNLTDGTALQEYAYSGSVFTSGNDVYVIANLRLRAFSTAIGSFVTKVWKNNSEISQVYGSARSLYISNGNIYLGGDGGGSVNNDFLAKLWKNGVNQNAGWGINGTFSSVFVPGAIGLNVYVAGSAGLNGVSVAKVWRNGVSLDLILNGNTSGANSLFIK